MKQETRQTILKGRIKGNVKSKEAIKIDGTIIGNIQTSKEVTISKMGVVIGNIEAKFIHNEGTIMGEMKAEQGIELVRHSIVNGVAIKEDMKRTQPLYN